MSKIDCVNCKYYNFNTVNDSDWCAKDGEETGLCGYCNREFEDLEEATQIYDNKEEECNKWYQIHLEQAVKIKDLEAKLTEKKKEINYYQAVKNRETIRESKLDFAIAELEKLEDYVFNNEEMFNDEQSIDIRNYVIKRIKELKEYQGYKE